ncbi:MAG: porin [Gammaproteobacteria bacterium]|nr:porin [Gammaproteobacteria bacterium]
MKKLITLAVAAALVAPMAASAETTLYGRLSTAVVTGDDDTDRAWDVETGTTRIGVKGGEDLGGGLKAIFQAEWSFTSDDGPGASTVGGLGNRLAYVGLSGGFGTVALGRQWTPYYGSVNKTDIFENAKSTNGANDYYIGLVRTGKAVAYVSPNFNGLQAKVAVIADRATGLGTDDGVDGYNISLDYNNGPISVGASILEAKDTFTNDRWGVGASYNFGMFKLIAQYEDKDDIAGAGAADSWAVGGEVYFGNNTVKLVYGQMDPDGGDELDVWGVGLDHNFSKATKVYVEYTDSDNDSTIDSNQLAIGLRHDF